MTATIMTETRVTNEVTKQHELDKNGNSIPHYPKYKFYIWEFETPIIWTNVFFITLWHAIAIWMMVTHSFRQNPGIVLYTIVLGGMTGFGVTAGAHRYFTHKSFKAKLPLKIILLFCFSLAGQNTLVEWVRDHRVHHKFSETDADPHNAKRGFFFSHVGWLMMRKHPEVIRKGRLLDLSDLTDDPLVAFHQKYFILLKILICFVIPTLVPPYLYGETWYNSIKGVCFVRYVVSLNATWAVNSFAHLWGNKPYDKRIYPSENLAVSFFAMGEGYHNYHHTFPWDYRTAEVGKMLNATTLWLNIFEKIGWAYDMKTPSEELLRKVVENHGDGTHYEWGHEVDENENRKSAQEDSKSA